MENQEPFHFGSGDQDSGTTFVSKEKLSALAEEIRVREDDLRHMASYKDTVDSKHTPVVKGSAAVPERCRESLGGVAPAHVSSLKRFWEGMMTRDSQADVGPSKPFRPIQVYLKILNPEHSKTKPACKTYLIRDETSPQTVRGHEIEDHNDGNRSTKVLLPPAPLTVGNPEQTCSRDESDDLPLPPPPQGEREISITDVDLLSKSADCIDEFNSPARGLQSFECPNTVQSVTHGYYDRPRIGASSGASSGVLRNWTNSSNLNSPSAFANTTSVPRQRSVTFAPKPGSAPGDTEGETDTYEALTEGSSEDGSAGMLRSSPTRRDVDVGALESAARLANSAERYCRKRVSSVVSDDNDSSDYIIDDSELCSFSAGSSSSGDLDDDRKCDSDNGLLNASSANRSRKSSFGDAIASRTTTTNKRMSREASALLDFDCPPTPTAIARLATCQSQTGKDNSVALRRQERINEIANLVDEERTHIMRLSNALTDLQNQAKQTPFSGKVNAFRGAPLVRPTFDTDRLELSRDFLLACQRRQALLEELSLLHKGSPVLVPPMRGEPMRGRFQLQSIRIALKSEAPFASGSTSSYVLIGNSATGIPTTPYDNRPSPMDKSFPEKFHVLAVIKCIGEGRIYHTPIATLMRTADLPPGSTRPTKFIDLPANLDIVPLRPDFLISIEIYCLKSGGGLAASTPTPSGAIGNMSFFDSPPASLARHCAGFRYLLSRSAKKKKKYNLDCSLSSNDGNSAYTLLSSVTVRHHDNLLYGCLPLSLPASARPPAIAAPTGMPLFLEGLPKSCPLSGPLGLNQASVRLQSAVLRRGFLSIFDESGGMGVWTRCWCKLLADQLVFWRYPEDEDARDVQPLGRIDIRHIVAPWVVEAPRKICVRANTIYMRSIFSVSSPKWLTSVVGGGSNGVDESGNSCATSILFHASSDYHWLEQRHLICADTPVEMEAWMTLMNKSLEVLQRWMPEHFACLARYDSKMVFNRPVAASIASRLKLQQTAADA